MQIQPYLFFNGEAGDAISFYKDALGAEVVMMMPMSEAPPEFEVPADRGDWVMHCTLKVGDVQFHLSDDFTANADPMAGCNVMITRPTATEAKSTFDALSEGGVITMPWTPTFWSAGFGTFTDKFGIRWMVGCDEVPAS